MKAGVGNTQELSSGSEGFGDLYFPVEKGLGVN